MAKDASIKKQKPAMFVVDDNGYAYHKTSSFGEDGKLVNFKVASVVEKSDQGVSTADGKQVNRYQDVNGTYSVRLNAQNPIDIRTNDYPLSAANRVLVTHCLKEVGAIGVDVHLGVTLPFREFFKEDGTIDTIRRDQVAKSYLENVVKIEPEGSVQPKIVSVKVYAEGLSSFFDWALTESGESTQNYVMCNGGEVAIIDIGGETTDLISLDLGDGLVIDNVASDTKKIGVLNAIKQLEKCIKEVIRSEDIDLPANTPLPRNFVEMVFSTGKGHFAGKRWELAAQRDKVLREQSEGIAKFIQATFRNLFRYSAIIVVGGGAIVFKEHLSKILKNATFLDEWSNARGAAKYMKFIDLKDAGE